MTGADWNSCTDPIAMLAFLGGGMNPSPRKSCLFCCACVRLLGDRFVEQSVCPHAVELCERLGDGLLEGTPLTEIRRNVGREKVHVRRLMAREAADERDYWLCRGVLAMVKSENLNSLDPSTVLAVVAHVLRAGAVPGDVAELLREVFNPFPSGFRAEGQMTDVVRLAEAAYEERVLPSGRLDPVRLAVLADALEETGCQDDGFVVHLRGAGPHVRGCWVIDAVLDRG